MATNLIVFDFDSTLYNSPLPNPLLWGPILRGRLVSCFGWFGHLVSLQITQNSNRNWWHQSTVEMARNYIGNPLNLVVCLTGRNIVFQNLIESLLAKENINMHMIITKPASFSGSTVNYKIEEIEKLIIQNPTIQHVEIYDDRPQQLKQMQFYLDGTGLDYICGLVHHHSKMYMDTNDETEFVHNLVNSYNEGFNDFQNTSIRNQTSSSEKYPVELRQVVKYTAIVLTDQSRQKLSKKFPHKTRWNSYCHHCTISIGSSLDLIHEIGGDNFLGMLMDLSITHYGFSETVEAVRVYSPILKTKHSIPHITLNVSPLGKPQMSNEITNWLPIEEIVVTGALEIVYQTDIFDIKPEKISAREKQISVGALIKERFPFVSGKQIGVAVKDVHDAMKSVGMLNLEVNRSDIFNVITLVMQKLNISSG